MLRSSIITLVIVGCVVLSCTKSHETNTKSISKKPQFIEEENSVYAKLGHNKLSDYGFFVGTLSELVPADRVLPYELNSALFSDYAGKKRFIYLPPENDIELNGDEVLEFPVGAVLIKNFYYSNDQLKDGSGRIIETRLLIREESEWKALPYIWNEAQTEAFLEITGFTTSVNLSNQKEIIDYVVPTMLECKSCHEKNGKIQPIGPTVRQLNRSNEYDGESLNQLDQMRKIGWIKSEMDIEASDKAPDYLNSASGSLEDRARSYLDVNCAHCHRPEGPAKNSGLNLRYNNEDLFSLGLNKGPVAAGKGSGGLRFDIVAGKPDESILYYRMNSLEPAIMMPELGRKTIHAEGLELIRKWIDGLGDRGNY